MTPHLDREMLVDVCLDIASAYGVDAAELALSRGHIVPNKATKGVFESVASGSDPLGESYMHAMTAASRRTTGETYTPGPIVELMVNWAASRPAPQRVVDCGCGSGRFALAAARAFPDAEVIAVDSSPLATLMCKANVSAAGLSGRVQVMCEDFTKITLPAIEGRTLWIGNPPYVRHHALSVEQKTRFISSARELGIKVSGLAGLHAHFVLSIARQMGERDFGCLVLSAEWMDVNYGLAMRELFLRMGLSYVRVFDPRERLFDGVETTSVIVGFDKEARTDTVLLVESTVAREVPMPSARLKWSQALRGNGADKAIPPPASVAWVTMLAYTGG